MDLTPVKKKDFVFMLHMAKCCTVKQTMYEQGKQKDVSCKASYFHVCDL